MKTYATPGEKLSDYGPEGGSPRVAEAPALTFDDVLLLPGYSEVHPRDVDTTTMDRFVTLLSLIMSLNLDMEEKQKLLELRDVIARAEQVGTELTNRMESLRFLAPFRKGGDPAQN